MAIQRKDIRQPVEVIVEEKGAEGKRLRGWPGNSCCDRTIGKKSLPVVMVERHALIGKVANDQALAAGAIIVSGIRSHSGARFPSIAKGHSGGEANFCKGPIMVVVVQLVGLCVIRDE